MMSLPNILTFTRILLTPIFIICLFEDFDGAHFWQVANPFYHCDPPDNWLFSCSFNQPITWASAYDHFGFRG